MILYNDNRCCCIYQKASKEYIFADKAKKVCYRLSGHPYESCVRLESLNFVNVKHIIRGTGGFPDKGINASLEEWKQLCKEIMVEL